MLRRLHRSIYLLSLLVTALSMSSDSASGQWQKVAGNLFRSIGSGAMCYSDGYIWLATVQLFVSTDSGMTWSERAFPDHGSGAVAYDLQFFDRLHGIMACGSGTYLTTDGGSTWKNILAGNFFSCCFGLSNSIIATASASMLGVSVTTDAGVTWTSRAVGDFPTNIRSTRDGKFLVFAGSLGTRGHIYASADLGLSWQERAGRADYDSYSFAIDSCDNDRLYLVNEDLASPTDDFSQIFLTTNGGQAWSIADEHSLPFYTGAIGIGYDAIYAPTLLNGVMRSSDRGVTWKSVGGPSNDFDTRFIAAINDNLVLAADGRGNVWRTTNGGGDSILVHLGKLIITPASVTLTDTLAPCQAPEQIIVTTLSGCGAPSIKRFSVEGRDSLDFLLISGARTDSIVLLFKPVRAGESIAQITILLSDGSTRSVPLAGFGSGPLQISMHTSDISNDTIGGSIYVPIIADENMSGGGLSFRLTYDTTMLDYLGSYPPNGTTDGTVSSGRGQATVSLANVGNIAKDSVIGYALFHIFPGKVDCSVVTIDSISIMNKATICAQSVQMLQSKVCSAVGCSTPLLSQLTRYRNIPHLTAHPNPNTGSFSLRSSAKLGLCSIAIIDGLGVSRASFERTIERNVPATLEISQLPQGAYSVVVRSSFGIESLHLLLIK